MKEIRNKFYFIFYFLQLLNVHSTLSKSDAHGASRLLLLDVDNTLYREQAVGVESQIIDGIYSYCKDMLDIEKDVADQLHAEYGSTVEGLQQTIWKDLSAKEICEKVGEFYRQVWNDVDPSSILMLDVSDRESSTGYSHQSSEERKLTRQLLKYSQLPITFASNSPSWHVYKVLRALGLSKLAGDSRVFTPDRLPSYPTKHDPRKFFSTELDDVDGDGHYFQNQQISFFDDSQYNLDRIKEMLPLQVDKVHKINRVDVTNDGSGTVDGYGESNLVLALLQDFGLLDPTFRLSQTRYLESKNKVDRESLHQGIWNEIVDELNEILGRSPDRSDQSDEILETKLRIVDLGAGLLSMLNLLLHGDTEKGLKHLIFTSASIQANQKTNLVEYIAYESNRELYELCDDNLRSWGFKITKRTASRDDGVLDVIDYQMNQDNVIFQVKLVLRDFSDRQNNKSIDMSERSPNLIIGCCFADLMDPEELVPGLLRSFGLIKGSPSVANGTLIYFPITFTGTTQFLPPRPFEFRSGNQPVPSDTIAFRSYARALERVLRHNLDPYMLQEVMEDHGFRLVNFGDSDWKIDPDRDNYLYHTMLYFFGSTGGPQLLKEGWNAAGWIERARTNRPSIQASNRDLLFRLHPETGRDVEIVAKTRSMKGQMSEILFTAPFKVTSVQKALPSLQPREVLIRTSYSLISSGTELKIFKGEFNDNAALDVNIKDMEDERMAYPLSYGYSLVGVVIDCGSDVSRDDYVGRTVFTFSSHASHVVTDLDAIQMVPEGIDPKDAIFMPSVETALSLIHDAHVRIGENVAVYGQGLIGLLVTALLRRGKGDTSSGRFDSLTAFDMIPSRLAMSSKMGATQALIPGNNDNGKFDVSIEVSGNARALQSAIDDTTDGGRIIIGSWYGNKDVSLKLGIDFHRSHKTIQTSQVSEIPASLSKLWSKERRFAFTWDLVRQVKPSQLLTRVLSLKDAQEAYEALNDGSEIAIGFKYCEHS